MRKLNLAIAFLAGTVVFSGCTLSKMIKLANDQDLTVTPNPLELHGGAVPFELSAVLPPKMLPSGKVYTINTIYKYDDQEVKVGSVEFKADDFPNSNDTAPRKSESFSFPYADGMNPGKLYVQGVASDPRSGKSKESPLMEIAPGLIMTADFAKPVYFSALADHGYNDKEELIPTNVEFFFEQGVSRLNPSFKVDGDDNKSKSSKLSAFIAEKNVTRTVTITGTHSPEGTETVNEGLAESRAKTIETFYRKQMKKYDYKGMADSIKFIIKPVIQNWASFKTALAAFDGLSASEKNEVTKIINGNGSFEDKAKAISELSFYDTILDEIYPGLRTAQTEILTVKVKKPNTTIAVLAKQIVAGSVSADTLTEAEFLFAATLTPSLDEKEAIYKSATKNFGSWVAHNNLGAVYIEKASKTGDKKLAQDAITQFEIAAKKNASAAEVSANLAAAQMIQGAYSEAYANLVKAEGATPSNDVKGKVKAMKGAVQLMQGEYDAAKASFASSTQSETVEFDYALTAVLNGDYQEAKGLLSKVDSDELDADASYLKAIVAARTNDAAGVASNLKNAVAKDPSLKDKALNDLEFAKYAEAVAKSIK